MKVLFAVTNLYLSEPLGAMLLMSICKNQGHDTKVVDVRRRNLYHCVREWEPDVIAYSAMTADMQLMKRQDQYVRRATANSGKKVFRIMGGPHPTYSPEVIDELKLDAICQGDGDRALPTFLERLEKGEDLKGIPNIGLSSAGAEKRELVDDLDNLPFADRDGIYESVPYYKECGLRSFLASRGCPYFCTYCFNHAYNKMFRGCGRILRRRSVENLITEIEYVIRKYPPVRVIRFGDDTFAHRADEWLEEFSEKYASRIKLPFYCLMRSNTLTEETARLLFRAGCQSISMSIEAGSESVRNDILKRNISDEVLIRSFKIAEKYKLNVYANTMIAIPGTTLNDDFKSLELARQIRPAVPSFGICVPYPGTDLWNTAIESDILDREIDVYQSVNDSSVLKCYSKKEKETQLRIAYLGTLFCCVPKFLAPFIYKLIKSNLSPKLCLVGKMYLYYRIAVRIFPLAIPRNPKTLLYIIRDTLKSSAPVKGLKSQK